MARRNAVRCGTRGGYRAHRRRGEDACAECKAANAAYSRAYAEANGTAGVVNLDDLAVECWCRSTIVHVPASTVRACRTASCGAPDCGPPEAA